MAAVVRDTDVKKLLNSFIYAGDDDDGGNVGSQTEKSDDNVISKATKPRDRHAYLQRVHTFTSMNWFAKPQWLSPLVCARYGWENTGVDCLHCVSCGKYISGRTPPSSNPTVYDDCSKRVRDSLQSGHTLACPWANCPSPQHFLKIAYATPQKALEMFKDRVSQLVLLEDRLPFITDNLLTAVDFTEEQVNRLVELCALTHDRDILMSAAVLSTTGWSVSSKNPNPMVSCDVCNRHVGLWNFLSLAKPEPDNTDCCISLDTSTVTAGEATVTAEEVPMAVSFSTQVEKTEAEAPDSMETTEIQNESISTLDSTNTEQEGAVPEGCSENCDQPGDKELEDGTNMKTSDESESLHPFDPESEETTLKAGDTVSPPSENSKTPDENADVNDPPRSPKESEISSCKGPSNVDTNCDTTDEKSEDKENLTVESSSPETNDTKKDQIVPLQEKGDFVSAAVSFDTDTNGVEPKPDGSLYRLDGSDLLNFAVGDKEDSLDEETNDMTECPPVKRPVTEEEVGEEAVEPIAKKQKIQQQIKRSQFNPLKEHYAWCPWVCSHQPEFPGYFSTSSPVRMNDQPGWLEVLHLLLPEFAPSWNNSIRHQANRTSPEALRSIRKLFNEWTSPDLSR